ncbi:MAG: hypothetical protein JNM44_14565 [Chitinophagaceae bacterium]|nr:hypothetical protein [Chitinophagaceae bacterium]
MDFRIAPMILATITLVYLLFIHPAINTSFSLKEAANYFKILWPPLLMMVLAWSVFARHSYYRPIFKVVFIILQVLSVGVLIWFLSYMHAQHL